MLHKLIFLQPIERNICRDMFFKNNIPIKINSVLNCPYPSMTCSYISFLSLIVWSCFE
jgi:hypothetical protein